MKSLFFVLWVLFLCLYQPAQAQKNGVTGYGTIEILYVGGYLSGDLYLGAGGGVVINDNLLFGVYLRALNKPYKFNAFEANQDTFGVFVNNPFSTNLAAISSIANNLETGASIGFNIMPDKPFQITFKGFLGLNIVAFSEITAIEDNTVPLGARLEDDFYTLFGFNSAAEVNFQFKIGSFFKLGLNGGYHFAYINGETRNGNLLKIPTMFSGPYFGASIVFGSF